MTITINQAINTIIKDVPGAPFDETVDVVKIGDPEQALSGIAVTFLANAEVLKDAAGSGLNFIITHEPVFYNHLDETGWLNQDPVLLAKQELIQSSDLVIWRFHDYLHSIPPDSTVMGLLEALGWEEYALPDKFYVCRIPEISFADLIQHVKTKLGIETLRIVGEMSVKCQGIALIPGAPGYRWQIGVLEDPDVDVMITGEISEWETPEYVRDANTLGINKGLIVSGHAPSEEPGMERMVPWLQERFPGFPVKFFPNSTALRTF